MREMKSCFYKRADTSQARWQIKVARERTANYYRHLIIYATRDYESLEIAIPGVPITLVTLTLPYLLVTFRLKPFFSGI